MQNCTKKNSYLDAPSKEIITTSGTYVLLLFLLFPRGTDRRNEMHASFTSLPQLQKALLTPYPYLPPMKMQIKKGCHKQIIKT